MASIQRRLQNKIKLKTDHFSSSMAYSKEGVIRGLLLGTKKQNMELYANILEENERLVPLLKAKLDELREKERSNFIVIGKGDCGRPCYAFNPVLFISWPECKGAVKEEYENGTYQKQVLDKETNQYVWREFHNEENICLHFNYNENVDPCDIDFVKMCDFFDKEDKEKTVHWSYIDTLFNK